MAKKKNRTKFAKPKQLQPLTHQIQSAKSKLLEVKKKKHAKLSKRERNMIKKLDRVGEKHSKDIDANISTKILRLAKEQLDDINQFNDSDSVQSEQCELVDNEIDFREDGDVYEELEISPEDQTAMERLFGINSSNNGTTLGDIIMRKMKEREQAKSIAEEEQKFSPEVVQVYTDVGLIMSKYRSGKVPKALKAIPNLINWEEILDLCNIDRFSNQAMFVLTRLLSSNLNEVQAQKYYYVYLLPRVRYDIKMAQNKTLNCHLFNSLRKALYKPAAFFKGIVIPLIEDSQTTLREAAIISSVLNSSSIPMLHSAATVLRILQCCSGVKSFVLIAPGLVFLKVLLNKKYNFPQRVIDELVVFFIGFIDYGEEEVLPVLWHQNVLILLQRYRLSLSADQRNSIRKLIKVKFHHQITPEIRRELMVADQEEQNRMMIGQ